MKRHQREEVKGKPELGPWLAQHCSSCFGSPSRYSFVLNCEGKSSVVNFSFCDAFCLFSVVTYIVFHYLAAFNTWFASSHTN